MSNMGYLLPYESTSKGISLPTIDRSIRYIGRLNCDTAEVYPGNPGKKEFRQLKTLTRTRTGVSQPKWRQLIANHQNATTSLTGTFVTIDSEFGTVRVKYRHPTASSPEYTDTAWGDWFGYEAVTPAWGQHASLADAKSRAHGEFRKKIRREQMAISGPTFLGELKETLRMLRNPGKGLSNLAKSYLDDVKRLKKRRPKNWKDNLSGLWLEQAFGWKPLLSDIESAIKAYERLNEEPRVKTLRTVGTATGYHDAYSHYSQIAPNCTMDKTVKQWDQYVIVCRGQVVASSEGTAPGWNNAQLFGFEPAEFIPTAWELLPWSFLVDYFTNIGDIIEASITDTSSLVWFNETVISKFIDERWYAPSQRILKDKFGARLVSVGGSPCKGKIVKRVVSRAASASLGVPKLTFELPGKPAQWSNMLALFTQATLIHPQRPFGHYRRGR